MVRRTVLAYGGLDILVASAGLATSAPVTETSLADWELNQAVLARGYFLAAREAFRVLIDQSRGGSVVFMRTDQKANLTDKSKPPVVIGVVDGDRSWEQMITWGAEYLGWNVRFVVGYPGSALMLLAVRRVDSLPNGLTVGLERLLA